MEKELDLVGKVDLRLALAESNEQLQNSLNSYLAPVLLKLASPHGQVRQAVFKIIQNVFPRITAATTLKLPFKQLLQQIQQPQVPANSDPTQVQLYSLLFLSKAIERLENDEKRELTREILKGIHGYPRAVAARAFSGFLKGLAGFTGEFGENDGFLDEKDKIYLTKTIGRFFLLLPNAGDTAVHMPGLSTADIAFFTKDAGVSYKSTAELLAAKKRVLLWMKGSGFSRKQLAVPLLIASTDGSSSINDIAEPWFKKLEVSEFFEDSEFISELVLLFLGTSETPPAKPQLQEKIMQLLTRSKTALSSDSVKKISDAGLLSEYAKLRLSTVSFIRAVTAEKGNLDKPLEFSTDILQKLKEDLMSEGWPELDSSQITNYRSAISLRTLKYEAIGDVLRNSPHIWISDLSPVEFLFHSLEGESVDLRPVLSEVLSGLTIHLPKLSLASQTRLKLLLRHFMLENLNSPNVSACRYIALKFTNCAFPFEDAEARLLCILGSSSTNSAETIEEAGKGLHPYYFNLLQSSNSTDFESSTEFLGGKSVAQFPSFSDMIYTLKEENLGLSLGTAVRFAFRVLVMQAVSGKSTVIVPDENWESRVDKAVEIDENVRGLVAEQISLLSSQDQSMDENDNIESPCEVFLQIVFSAFYNQYFGGIGHPLDTAFADVLCLVLLLSPMSLISSLSGEIDKFHAIVSEKALADKSLGKVCQGLAIVASSAGVSNEKWLVLTQSLLEDSLKSSLKARLLAASYVVSRANLVGRPIDAGFFQNLVAQLKASVSDGLQAVALEGISQLAVFGALESDTYKTDVAEIEAQISPKAKSNELAVLTLAKLALTGPPSDLEELTPTEQLIYDSHNSKQIDFTFTTGEAFLILAGGWKLKTLKQELDIREADISSKIPPSTARLPITLNTVLGACQMTKPALRKSGCIWLLSLVQYLGEEPEIRGKAKEIHVAFMRFLADRDEFIQESASRGLSLVYELGDNDLKETLVKGLVKSFTDGGGIASGTVDHDTELFDSDVLKTHDGSVSTYKDVLNLASEVGDPSLVYKFMSLAKSSALWLSRKGMAFGLGSIMAKLSLDEMLDKNSNLSARLIPRLFRYRFDPNMVVSKLMNDIWSAIVKDTPKTVRANFDVILAEILKSMGSKEWRVRQASTAALMDLLQTLPLEQYEPRLEEIWNMSFRAMDDIKESVRKEGTQLLKSLAKTLSRTADVSTGKATVAQATEVMNKLIPFFLGNKGLLSDAEDVRNFALETILDLCKIGGKAIKPHVPGLLETFVELMSTLEPEVVNYLVLNADKYNLNSSDVDAKRLQSLGNSSMMDAIEKLLAMVDESLMPDIVDLIARSVKKSVGLPSKVSGSRVIVSLVTKNVGRPDLTKPFGDKLLHICRSQLSDRNVTIACSYASAAGYVCKIAPMDSVVAYGAEISRSYFNSESDDARKIAAVASESVSRYSGADVFSAVCSAFLPLSFVGKHDESDAVKADFEREWTENSNGDSAARLYFSEICSLAEEHGKLSNFSVRQRIARSMVTLAGLLDALNSQNSARLFGLLLELVQGKSWAGKELVLDALVRFSVKNSAYLISDSELLDKIANSVNTEAKRRNKNYQIHAILSVGLFLHEFPDFSSVVDTYIENMGSILSDEYLEEIDITENLEKPTKTQEQIALEELHLKFLRNIFDSISGKSLNNDLLQFAFEQIIAYAKSDHTLTWRTCNGYNEFFKKLLDEIKENSTPLGKKELSMISKGFSILFEFGEKGSLEKTIIMLARNSKSLLDLFALHGAVDELQYVVDNINALKQKETSTITLNELEKATAN